MAKEKTVNLNNSHNLGLYVFMLLLIVLASFVLLYSVIDVYANRDVNVVALMPAKGRGEAPELKPDPDGDPEHFYADSKIDLFKNVYTNKKGKVVAESANGDKIIAPGTANTMEFSLKNTGNISMDYTMNLEGIFSMEKQELPIEVRLRSGSEWLIGDVNTWCSPDELKSVEIKNTVESGRYVNYTLDWRWEFDAHDAQDNLLASVNGALTSEGVVDVSFALKIHTLSVITEGAEPQLSFVEKLIQKYSAEVVFGVPSAIIAVSLLGLIVYAASHDKNNFVLVRKETKGPEMQNEDETDEENGAEDEDGEADE